MRPDSPSRRTFLKQSAAATALAVAVPSASHAAWRPNPYRGIPPHRPMSVPGVHVYADRESVFPGEAVRFHVSADAPCEAAIYRLGTSVDDPASDTFVRKFDRLPPIVQPIHPGSYVHVPSGLRSRPAAFTVEAWVRPWRLDRLMGVISQEDKRSSEGWALGIGKDGYVGFYLGDRVSEDEALVHRTAPGLLSRGRWHHLVATWDGREKRVYVDGNLAGTWP
ncbi:MAG: LamG domain-containing protein, partial [Verrucomicrobiales bacterium]|nr:LamG domain-containing protein [Verrucomicrobiales bacterium]